MSEKSLNQVGEEAAANYARYRNAYHEGPKTIEGLKSSTDAIAGMIMREQTNLAAGSTFMPKSTDFLRNRTVNALARKAVKLEEAKAGAAEEIKTILNKNEKHFRHKGCITRPSNNRCPPGRKDNQFEGTTSNRRRSRD